MNIKDFDPFDFSIREIQGVPVYFKHLPWAPCVHIQYSISAGAFTDPVGKEGAAHFLEHIIGNGSPTLPDKKAMREFSRLYMLNTRNAHTSHYKTYYTGKCLPEHLPTVLEKMEEYVFQPVIKPDDVEHERKVITQEAWRVYRNGKYLAYAKELFDNLYHGHERERIASPLGWPDTVVTITQEDLKEFHRKNYVKENLKIFLVGAIEAKDLDVLEKILKKVPSGEKNSKTFGTISKPKELRMEKRSDDIGNPREQVEFTLTRASLHMDEFSEEAMEQTRALLQDTLYERLRLEHSLCYAVNVSWRIHVDFMEINVTIETSEDKIKLVEEEIWNMVNEIQENKWQDRFNVIHKTTIDLIRSKERQSEFIIDYAAKEAEREGKITSLNQILEEVAAVTYQDVCRVLKKVFDKEHVLTSIILPAGK